jgi:hypothetical protein
MNQPIVNLGQSQFQDIYFVAGAQLTPYRTLRQLQLQINELEGSLKKADINKRRTIIKIHRLDLTDELQALDAEEFTFDLNQQEALIVDAKGRLDNYLKMKEELLGVVPKSYWDAGFEAAEKEHWTAHFAKQLAISRMTGIPDKQLAEQMMLLPQNMISNILQLSNEQSSTFENKPSLDYRPK